MLRVAIIATVLTVLVIAWARAEPVDFVTSVQAVPQVKLPKPLPPIDHCQADLDRARQYAREAPSKSSWVGVEAVAQLAVAWTRIHRACVEQVRGR